jgi:anhydro-N-acetylmuramic acid kinase
MLLNYLAEKQGLDYDANGDIARSGKIDTPLLLRLNDHAFYKQDGARSLGREWFEEHILGLVNSSTLSIPDLLATATEHVAQTIAAELNRKNIQRVLITGGGAFNTLLAERIKAATRCELIIPEPNIINYKEALIFAFLGYLRLQNKTNTIKSVTGASADSIGGAVYLGR